MESIAGDLYLHQHDPAHGKQQSYNRPRTQDQNPSRRPISGVACSNGSVAPPARIIAEPSKETSLKTGPSRAPSSRGKAISPVQVCEPAIGAVAGQRANSKSIAAVAPLSRLIREKGKELKTPPCCHPNVTKRLKRKVQVFNRQPLRRLCWIPLPHFEVRFCPLNASVTTVFDGQL